MKQRLITSFVLIIEFVLIYNFGSRIIYILNTQKHIDKARSERNALESAYQRKMAEYEYIKTDMYVEEIARTKLGLSKPGEYVFIIPTDSAVKANLPEIELDEETKNVKAYGEIPGWFRLFFN